MLVSYFRIFICTQKDNIMNIYLGLTLFPIKPKRGGVEQGKRIFFCSVCGDLNLAFLQIKTSNPNLKIPMYCTAET